MPSKVIIIGIILIAAFALASVAYQYNPGISSNLESLRGQIFPGLETSASTSTSSIVVRTDKSSYNYGEVLYWNVTGLAPNAAISIGIPDAGIGFAPDNVADSTGFASASFTPSDYLQPGNHILRATLASDSSKYGEATFTLTSPCTTPTLPVTIYSTSHFDWVIKKAQVYCDYLSHKQDVSAFFPLPELLLNWYTTNLGGADKMNFRITFVLDTPGGGYASGHEFGIADDAFWNYNYNLKGWWAYQLMAHEFGNLYTGNTLSGGWPCDWWADHGACPSVPGVESPAPASFANTALHQINWQSSAQVSQDFYNQNKNDVLFIMFRDKLIGQYGIGMFNRSFAAMRQDSMDWTKIDNGKDPGALLTNYVAAYLTIGTGTDLSPLFSNYSNQPYPSGMTGFDSGVMNDIIAARNLIYIAISQGKDVTAAWNAYRTGKYQDVKNFIVITTTTTSVPPTTTIPTTTTTRSTTTTTSTTSTTLPTTSTSKITSTTSSTTSTTTTTIPTSSTTTQQTTSSTTTAATTSSTTSSSSTTTATTIHSTTSSLPSTTTLTPTTTTIAPSVQPCGNYDIPCWVGYFFLRIFGLMK